MTYLYRLVSTIFLLLNFSIAFAENNVSTDELFENKIRKFILENPEVILDSLRNYEEKININAKKVQKELIESEIVRSLDKRLDYVGGNLDGKITMFEFLDYKCGYCKKAHAEVKYLLTPEFGHDGACPFLSSQYCFRRASDGRRVARLHRYC